MKTLVRFGLLAVACIQIAIAISTNGFFRDPENPGMCTIKKDLVLSPGDIIEDPDLECGKIICGLNGLVIFHGCDKKKVEGCEMGAYVNKSLPHPYCCERNLICD